MRKNNESVILYTDEFKRIIKELENNKDRVLIITGARQSGKTTVLKEYEKIETLKNNIVLSIDFEKYYLSYLSQKIRQTYIELVLCKELLNKIKNTYIVNNLEIQKLFFQVDRKIMLLCDYINCQLYNESESRVEFLSKGSLLSKILNEIKKSGINKIILEIDRFDWIGESSKYYQQGLLSYNDTFDKIIITSDDETLFEQKKVPNGIGIIKVDYSENIDFVKKLINNKIKSYKFISINIYRLLKDENFAQFVTLCKGNIDIIFKVVDILNDTNECFSDGELLCFISSEVDKKSDIYRLIKKKKIYINE